MALELATNPECIEHFQAKGYVVVPDLLSDDECKRFGDAVDHAVATRCAGDRRTLGERTRYEQSFRQVLNLWEDFPDVRPLSFHPGVARTAAEILGAPAVRVWHDQALYKEAGGRLTGGHYDQAYWPLSGHNNITAWIPFDGSTIESGAMGYVAGSHLDQHDKFPNIFSEDGFDLERGPESAGRGVDWVEVARGSVAFHHSGTLYTAGPNTTDHTRRVHTVIFFAEGCTRTAHPPSHPSVARPGIAVGDAVASDLTPIAWPPRPAGDLPPPPESPDPATPGWPGWSWERVLARKAHGKEG